MRYNFRYKLLLFFGIERSGWRLHRNCITTVLLFPLLNPPPASSQSRTKPSLLLGSQKLPRPVQPHAGEGCSICRLPCSFLARLPWRQHLAEVILLLPRSDTHIQSSSPRSPHWAEEISSLVFLRHCSTASSSLAALGNYNSHSAALGGWPQRGAEPGSAFRPCAGCWPWGDPRSQRIPVPLGALRYVGCSVTGAVC